MEGVMKELHKEISALDNDWWAIQVLCFGIQGMYQAFQVILNLIPLM